MIREKDGIHFFNGEVVADSRSSRGELTFMSHAHMDHAHNRDGEIICSDLTAKLASRRTGKKIEAVESSDLELVPSGHILGSTAALFGEDERVLYTGDVSTRDRAYLDGFEPPEADVLVLETTYGVPAYRFPPQEELESRIVDWISDTPGPLFLFAYSLGKAQKINYLAEKSSRPVYVHEKVWEMNQVIEENTELEFNAEKFEGDLPGDGVFIGPPGSKKGNALQDMISRVGGKTASFTGWASNGNRGYDQAFPFSDHCDFDDLVELVLEVDPEKVYTFHGFDRAFASYLSREHGFNARALGDNQASLTDF